MYSVKLFFAVVLVGTASATAISLESFQEAINLRTGSSRSAYTKDIDCCLGMSTDKSDIKFILSRHRNSPVEINYGDVHSLEASGFNPAEQTYIIIDGMLSNFSSPMSQAMCHFLPEAKNKSNVIIVDWGKLSGAPAVNLNLHDINSFIQVYLCALRNTPSAGSRVSEMITFLNVEPKNVHIIGHSLGAHVSRITADDYHVTEGKKISRVTFLDPANTGSSDKPFGAHFVDAYHTNRCGLGTSETKTGDIDVFFNGGCHQPGCPVVYPPTLASEYCSHEYSWKSFVASFKQQIYAEHCFLSSTSPESHPNCLDSNTGSQTSSGLRIGLDMRNEPTGSYAVFTDEKFHIPSP